MHTPNARPQTRVNTDEPGYLRGRRASEYWSDVKQLERQGRLKEAEELLLELVEVDEREAAVKGLGVVGGYYLRLAIIYRKQQRYEDEIAILERFARQEHAPGVGPPRLLKRLEKARRSSGDPSPRVEDPTADDVAAMARSPLGNADEFLHAIRTARHYAGSSVLTEDAPLRTRVRGVYIQVVAPQHYDSSSVLTEDAPLRIRGETAPAYTKVVAPQPIPSLAERIGFRQELNPTQAAFYEAWRTDFEAGKAWTAPARRKERSLSAYGFTYAHDLLHEARLDPGAAATYLERLADAYPRLRDHVTPWARDAWLLACDLQGALDSSPKPRPGHITALNMNLRLTLKHLLGLQLDAQELFGLYMPKVTPAVRERIDALVPIVQSRLDAEHRSGANFLDDLVLDPTLELSGWPLWNVSHNGVLIEEAPFGRFSELESGEELVANLQRAAENALREDMGLPHVGEGWVSETQLFVELRDALDTEVIPHGVPDGFGQQHLNVWIPAWRIGVEYQGPSALWARGVLRR